MLRETGSYSKTNPYRFSTKYTDADTDFVYYGYRYYNPGIGRWVNRDPIGDEAFRLILPRNFNSPLEEGSVYAFVENNPVSRIDLLGLLSKFEDCSCCQLKPSKTTKRLRRLTSKA